MCASFFFGAIDVSEQIGSELSGTKPLHNKVLRVPCFAAFTYIGRQVARGRNGDHFGR